MFKKCGVLSQEKQRKKGRKKNDKMIVLANTGYQKTINKLLPRGNKVNTWAFAENKIASAANKFSRILPRNHWKTNHCEKLLPRVHTDVLSHGSHRLELVLQFNERASLFGKDWIYDSYPREEWACFSVVMVMWYGQTLNCIL